MSRANDHKRVHRVATAIAEPARIIFDPRVRETDLLLVRGERGEAVNLHRSHHPVLSHPDHTEVVAVRG